MKNFGLRISLLNEMKRYDSAERLIRYELQLLPREPSLHNLLGLCFHAQGKFGEALKSFRKAWQLDAQDPEPGLNLAATLADLGRYEDAEEVFEELHKIEGSIAGKKRMAQFAYEKSEILEAGNKISDAITAAEESTLLVPDSSEYRMQLARLLVRSSEYERARVQVDAALHLKPENGEAHELLALIFHRLGLDASAQEHWIQAKELLPERAQVLSFMAGTSA